VYDSARGAREMAGFVAECLASRAWGRWLPCDLFFAAICYCGAGAVAMTGAERGVAGESVG